jgi:hypothetical protein
MVGRMRRLLAARDKTAADADKASFKQRYGEAEQRRAAILQRLAGLNDAARAHPAYGRALTLVNQTFRKASVAQRLATLQAAEWLINVLENLTTLV